MSQKTLDQIINVNSEEEFEQAVYSMIKSGQNPREILKKQFQMNGTKIKLNVTKIKQIKDKFDSNTSKLHRDSDKALMFKCFKEDLEPVDVVIKYGLDSDYVQKAYLEFIELQNMVVIPFEIYDRLYCAAWRINKFSNDSELCDYVDSAVDAYMELEKHVYFCSVCSEDISIRGKSLEDAQAYLSPKWQHTEC